MNGSTPSASGIFFFGGSNAGNNSPPRASTAPVTIEELYYRYGAGAANSRNSPSPASTPSTAAASLAPPPDEGLAGPATRLHGTNGTQTLVEDYSDDDDDDEEEEAAAAAAPFPGGTATNDHRPATNDTRGNVESPGGVHNHTHTHNYSHGCIVNVNPPAGAGYQDLQESVRAGTDTVLQEVRNLPRAAAGS